MRIRISKQMHEKIARRLIKRARIRKKVTGTAERPRVAVFKSNKYIYAQAIDDVRGVTLAALDTKQLGLGKKVDHALVLGQQLGQKLLSQQVSQVVFDRGGYPFHGRVKAVCEGLRQSGIQV